MQNIERFTGLYSLSKTLRFELKPVGSSLQHIVDSGVLEEDRHRAESYKKVKALIDEYHKTFIDSILANLVLAPNELEQYSALYHKSGKTDVEKKAMEKIKETLRKHISDAFSSSAAYKRIAKKELIQEDLPNFLMGRTDDLELVEEFHDFTTYFGGFHENRANMYSKEAQATAIGFRIIHENLPRFIDNIDSFRKISSVADIAEKLPALYAAFEDRLNVSTIEEVFMLDNYSHVLTQRHIEVYNALVGGKSEGSGAKLQGLNELVNLYNQQHKDAKLPLLKRLYNQILSDRESLSWVPDQFEADSEVLAAVRRLWEKLAENTLPELKSLLQRLMEYDTNRIYVPNDLSLTAISQKAYGNWSVVGEAIKAELRKATRKKKNESEEKYEERIEKLYKNCDSFSLKYIDDAVAAAWSVDDGSKPDSIVDYYKRVDFTIDEDEGGDVFDQLNDVHLDVAPLLQGDYPANKKLVQDKGSVVLIKALLDALKALQRFVKPLLGHGDEGDKDERFYGELLPLWEQLDLVTPLYNKVRNYLTQKPYSQEKIKVNFENSTLAAGWDQNKERDNTCVILRRKGLYYLAIMNKQYNRLFEASNVETVGECYDKMVYKLIPGANKMFPKVFFSKSHINYFNPSPRLLAHYQAQTHIKGDGFNLQHCRELIDFFKASIEKHEEWSKFGFKFSPTSTYFSLNDFYREVDTQAYKLTFTPVSVAYVDRLVSEGKLYLFQIYNKDFSSYSHGTPNMHTLYWRMLFDERNLADVVYQLNGGAEVFFRKKSITTGVVVHPKGQAITNKNPLNAKRESTFDYDITKNRRYTVDKFQLHVPITLNFKAPDAPKSPDMPLNPIVRSLLAQSTNAHVIGIDRGERHLLYLTVVNRKGEIVEQRSMNTVENTDYHDLLDQRERQRQRARNEWDHIEGIKDLKEGYLSQIVHQVAGLMVRYNAIVVLEDLNFGFKRGRQKVEKQVYQKFEKMLIDKLNYLVDKSSDPGEPGGLLHAYQLTNKFQSFAKMGKQNGMLFYIPAWNTSKIDPVTGFVNLLDTRYTNAAQARDLFARMDAIRYNAKDDRFEFDIDYDKFTTKATGTRTRWTLCSYGDRIETFRNPDYSFGWDHRVLGLTESFKTFFTKQKIALDGDLRAAILARDGKDFFEPLLHLLRLTLQMRNSLPGSTLPQDDYIISPVCDADGHFFDSRVDHQHRLPQDADANGAYNIARKGLMIIRQLHDAQRSGIDINGKDFRLDLSNKAWLRFAQEKPYPDE